MNNTNKNNLSNNNTPTYKELPKQVQRSVQTINKNNPLPLYQQLFDSLHNVIVKKKLEPGSFFATESLLQNETLMSRATIRRALDELVRQEYLIRITGKGTFVSISFPNHHIVKSQLKSLSQELKERGMKPGSILLQYKKINPPEKVAKKLEINPDEFVLYTERIRTGNDIPILYLCSYIPMNIGIYEIDNIPDSLFQLIEGCGKTISSATQVLNATIIPSEIANHLGLKRPSAGLTMERTTFDLQNIPVIYEEGIFRSDLYNYTILMQKK